MQRKVSVHALYLQGGTIMKKAFVLIPVCLIVGGILYHIIQAHRVTAELASGYPALSLWGQIKKRRTKYACVGR